MLSAPTARTRCSAAQMLPDFETPAASRYARFLGPARGEAGADESTSPACTATPFARAHPTRSSAVIA